MLNIRRQKEDPIFAEQIRQKGSIVLPKDIIRNFKELNP